MVKNILYCVLFFGIISAAHLFLFKNFYGVLPSALLRYYLFLAFLLTTIVLAICVVKMLYPDYVGFAFMGLVFFKLAASLIFLRNTGSQQIPDFKLNVVMPYLALLVLETYFAAKMAGKR